MAGCYQLLAEPLTQFMILLQQKKNQKERHGALKQNKESAEGVVKEFLIKQ